MDMMNELLSVSRSLLDVFDKRTLQPPTSLSSNNDNNNNNNNNNFEVNDKEQTLTNYLSQTTKSTFSVRYWKV